MDYIACTIAEIEGGPAEDSDVYGGVLLHLESEKRRFMAQDYGKVTLNAELRVGDKIRALMAIGTYVRCDLVDHPLEFQIGSGSDQLCGEFLGLADVPALVKGCRITSYAIGMVLDRLYFRVETGIGEILLPGRRMPPAFQAAVSSADRMFVKVTRLRFDLLGVV